MFISRFVVRLILQGSVPGPGAHRVAPRDAPPGGVPLAGPRSVPA